MHTIHHTRAVIIKSQPSGEANKLFWLFTEELGLVVAVATGVRKHDSKLRSQLTEYTFITADLVKGKDVWRLVSATALFDPLGGHPQMPLARPYVRTLATLERFLVDEGVHTELFAHIEESARAVQTVTVEPAMFDALAIWRTLVHLGYIAIEDGEILLFTTPFVDAIRLLDTPTTKKFVALVNATIRETHL